MNYSFNAYCKNEYKHFLSYLNKNVKVTCSIISNNSHPAKGTNLYKTTEYNLVDLFIVNVYLRL